MGAFAILIIGLFNLFAPRAAWFVSIGWKIRDAEPSDTSLIVYRIGGGVACIIAIFLFIAGTGVKDSSTPEQLIRSNLESGQIQSATLQTQIISSFNSDEVISWIINANWNKPAIDYSKQTGFSALVELDLYYTAGNQIVIFDMGNGQFGISENGLYPEYVFASPSLKSWFSAHGY